MRCLICKKNKIVKINKIDNVNILECKDCQLGFVDQKQISNHRSDKLYNLKDYKNESARLRNRFNKLAAIIAKSKPEGKLLDVGGGFGLFSSILHKTGKYNITLLEPSQTPVFAKKKDMRILKTNFQKFAKTHRGKFNVILMSDVIEHFTDPIKQLKLGKKLLAKDGILVIQTPNYRSSMAAMVKNWSWWLVEEHKFFFSPKSIRLLLKKLGFYIQYFSTYEDFIDFKKNLDGNFSAIKNSLMRKITKVLFFVIFIPCYFVFRNRLWKKDRGGLIFVVVKPLI